MQGFQPFRETPFSLQEPTDTAHPFAPVPILYFHSFDHPFCDRPECACHASGETIALLLRLVTAGSFTLAQVTDAANGTVIPDKEQA